VVSLELGSRVTAVIWLILALSLFIPLYIAVSPYLSPPPSEFSWVFSTIPFIFLFFIFYKAYKIYKGEG